MPVFWGVCCICDIYWEDQYLASSPVGMEVSQRLCFNYAEIMSCKDCVLISSFAYCCHYAFHSCVIRHSVIAMLELCPICSVYILYHFLTSILQWVETEGRSWASWGFSLDFFSAYARSGICQDVVLLCHKCAYFVITVFLFNLFFHDRLRICVFHCKIGYLYHGSPTIHVGTHDLI